MNKKKVLINAQKSGAKVKVIYKAGSQSNHAREIIPIAITNNQVFAQCLNSNTKKSFYISKLKILTDQEYENLTKWNQNFIPVTDYEKYEIRRNQRKKMVYNLCYCVILILTMVILFVYFTLKSKIS